MNYYEQIYSKNEAQTSQTGERLEGQLSESFKGSYNERL